MIGLWPPLPLRERVGVRGEKLTRIETSVLEEVAFKMPGEERREVCTFLPLTPALSHKGRGSGSLVIFA